jgi:pimeloyl-ACP methyl ester carboxylesterase
MTQRLDQPEHVGNAFFTRTDFWGTFRHNATRVGTTNIHFVEGGTGEPILLLPGWPQSWYAWRYVMVQLVAAGRRVIAIDPRGMGESDAPRDAYDLATVAAEIHALARITGLLEHGPLDVAGHDVGAWIGYAYAADWPDDVRRLALLDALIPGLSTPRTDLDLVEANLRSWHFAFNRLDDLPKILVARQLGSPGALAAAGEYYKSAFSPAGIEANRKRAETPLAFPVLALGAERGVGDGIVNALKAVASNVEGGVIAGVGHYLPEEAPTRIAAELIRFFGRLEAGMRP